MLSRCREAGRSGRIAGSFGLSRAGAREAGTEREAAMGAEGWGAGERWEGKGLGE